MSTLKECKENERKTNQAIQTVEKYLNCKNGHWNNVKKVYTFEFGEKFNEREIELSHHALFHIESVVTNLNEKLNDLDKALNDYNKKVLNDYTTNINF